MAEHVFLMIFPEMRDEFRIAMRGKAVSFRFELLLDFEVIEEFAVEDGGDGAIFVVKRLFAVREADDAETAVGEADAGLLEITVLIRAAMNDGVGHALQNAVRHGPVPRQIHNPCDAAHASNGLSDSQCRPPGAARTLNGAAAKLEKAPCFPSVIKGIAGPF